MPETPTPRAVRPRRRRGRQERVTLTVPVPARHFQLVCALYGNRLELVHRVATIAVVVMAGHVRHHGWPEGAAGYDGPREEVHAHVKVELTPLDWADVMRAVDVAGVSLTTFVVTALLAQSHHLIGGVVQAAALGQAAS